MMLFASMVAKSIGVSNVRTTEVCPVPVTALLCVVVAMPLSWPISRPFWQAVIPPNDTIVARPAASASWTSVLIAAPRCEPNAAL